MTTNTTQAAPEEITTATTDTELAGETATSAGPTDVLPNAPSTAEPVAAPSEPKSIPEATERPTAEPVAEEPAAEGPVAEEPAAKEPAVHEPVADEPAADEPATEELAAAEPAAEAEAPETGAPEKSPADDSAPGAAATGAAATGGEQQATTEAPALLNPQVEALQKAMEAGEAVSGSVIGWNKGGFHVVINGVPAFCPKSQIEIGNPKRASSYIDRTMDFKVTEIREGGKRILVSRRDVLQVERAVALEALRAKRTAGEAIEGRVTSLVDFGLFVELGGGLEGLVHLSQLSRKHVTTPREVAQIGQTVRAKILKIEKGGERISLSMKALEPDPWDSVSERFSNGDRFKGTVLRTTDFGAFVALDDGLEGLLHSSQLTIGMTLESEELQPGKEIEGWIREVDPGRKRLSLSLREVAANDPWKDVGSNYAEGDEVEGTIEQIAKFGVFVQLEPGLTGLLPFAAVSLPVDAQPRRHFQPGQNIRVVIDSLDKRRRRISLAPIGAKLEGTKADFKAYRQQSSDGTALGAMAAAFSKLRES